MGKINIRSSLFPTKKNNIKKKSSKKGKIIRLSKKVKNKISSSLIKKVNENLIAINSSNNNFNSNHLNSINNQFPNDKNIYIESNMTYNNSNEINKNNGIASLFLYGLILGGFGTLLLWYKNPNARVYLKSRYQNISTESILYFFKSFKTIDIKTVKDIIKDSVNTLYQFISDYSHLWSIFGMIVMVYSFWLIFKLFIKKNKK